nr:hypothetical protein BaRGS_024052 [Batillaria attramentaria]
MVQDTTNKFLAGQADMKQQYQTMLKELVDKDAMYVQETTNTEQRHNQQMVAMKEERKKFPESAVSLSNEKLCPLMKITVLGPVIFQGLGPGRGNGITAQRYMDQVLHPHVLPFFQAHGNWVKQCVNQ